MRRQIERDRDELQRQRLEERENTRRENDREEDSRSDLYRLIALDAPVSKTLSPLLNGYVDQAASAGTFTSVFRVATSLEAFELIV